MLSEEIVGTIVVPFLVKNPWVPVPEPPIFPAHVRLPEESIVHPVEEELPASFKVVGVAARLKVVEVESKSPPLTSTSPVKNPFPTTCRTWVGADVPIPNLPDVLFQKKSVFPVTDVAPDQNVTCPAVPPDSPPHPEHDPSIVKSVTLAEPF